jgi:sulfonate transport system substrate-binding protein
MSILRRRTRALVLVPFALSALAACGSDAEPSAAGAITQATHDDGDAGGTTVPPGTVLRVADQLGGLEVPLRLSGELDDVPYEIEWSSFASGPLVNEAIAAGEVDLGPMGDTPAILSLASELDTVVVAVRESTGRGATIIANAGTGIETLADLEGHTVAYTTGTSAHGFVLRALDSVGLTEDDIEQVDVPITDVATVLDNGDADAAAVYEVFRPAFEANNPDAVPLVSLTDLVPNYSFLLSPRNRAEDPAIGAAIEDFVARLARASTWVQDHENEFIDAYYVGELHQEPANARAAYELQGQSTWIESSPDVLAVQQEQADLLFEAGRIPEAVDLSPQFDPDLTTRFSNAIQEALS